MTTPEQHRRYNQSEKGKARNLRLRRQRTEAQARYRVTTKGLLTQARSELTAAHRALETHETEN